MSTLSENLPAVEDVIPHRFPFRFLDEVTTFDGTARAEGRWFVDPETAFFTGHFPQRPMVPGVILTEAIAQLGAYAILMERRDRVEAGTAGINAERIPVFGGVDKVRFRRMVEPGETVELKIELTQQSARAGRGQGTASVGGELACKAALFFIMA